MTSDKRRVARQRERKARKDQSRVLAAEVRTCGAAEASLWLEETRQERKARLRAKDQGQSE